MRTTESPLYPFLVGRGRVLPACSGYRLTSGPEAQARFLDQVLRAGDHDEDPVPPLGYLVSRSDHARGQSPIWVIQRGMDHLVHGSLLLLALSRIEESGGLPSRSRPPSVPASTKQFQPLRVALPGEEGRLLRTLAAGSIPSGNSHPMVLAYERFRDAFEDPGTYRQALEGIRRARLIRAVVGSNESRPMPD